MMKQKRAHDTQIVRAKENLKLSLILSVCLSVCQSISHIVIFGFHIQTISCMLNKQRNLTHTVWQYVIENEYDAHLFYVCKIELMFTKMHQD